MPRALPLPADERRAAIMAATEPLLERHGRDVSTRQIAEAAGIAEGTIFRVFPSKDALLDSVLDGALDPAAACSALLRIDPDSDLEDRLVGAVEVLQARMRRVVMLFHALLIGRDGSRKDLRTRQAGDDAQISAALEVVLAPDADRLLMPPGEAATLLRSLTFALGHPMITRNHGQSDLTARQIVEIFLYGVARRTSSTKEHLSC